MMNASDNVMAECIAREVAAAINRPLSFAGAVDAVTNRLGTAHIDIDRAPRWWTPAGCRSTTG